MPSPGNSRLSIWRDGININRGEIYLAALDPAIGSEISKTRPVIVISNDINNKYSSTVTILPITSQKLREIYPFEVGLPKGSGGLAKNSKVKADQIRTLDKSRLIFHQGTLTNDQMEAIDVAIKIHLALQ